MIAVDEGHLQLFLYKGGVRNKGGYRRDQPVSFLLARRLHPETY